MGQPAARSKMTPEEYLAYEAESPVKHEYVQGEVFAMSGTTKNHNLVTSNMHVMLRTALRGGPCRAYIAEVKVRVESANAYFYPDVHATCDPRDHDDPLVSRHPSVIVEVLSDSTADYDRGGKFAMYRQLESLREYVLVDSREQRVDVFRRSEHGWVYVPLEAGDTLSLESVGVTVPVAALYEETDVPEQLPAPEERS